MKNVKISNQRGQHTEHRSEKFYGSELKLYEEKDFSELIKLKKIILVILIILLVVTKSYMLYKESAAEKTAAENAKIISDTIEEDAKEIELQNLLEQGPGVDGYDDELLSLSPPEISQEFVDINEYSRVGQMLDSVDNIVVHYVGNPGTTAAQNRSYYQQLKLTQETKASSNFVVGLQGEIIEAVPMNEVAYASNQLNRTSISIETCHYTEAGNFTDATMESLVHLCAWLCLKYDLEATDVIRHYDVTGKICPKYYVENQNEWDSFIKMIEDKMN